jgi:N-acetyl-anhydromuramyl-L-alanine amidase AmpD
VATSDSAWHAGVVVNATAPLVLEHSGVNPNLWSIGIEHEGRSGDTLTDAQYAASLWLCRDLVKTFAIQVDQKFFIPHHTINAQHAGCPGTGFPLDRLLGDLTEGV